MKSYRIRILITLSLVLLMGAFLVACGGEDPTPTPEPQPVNTPVPPPTDTPEPPPPTDTPVPPTETPVPEPEVGADFVPFESLEGGFTLRYPDGWFTADFFGFAMFASHEELLDAPDPGEEGGVAVVIAGDAAEYESEDPIALLEEASAEMDVAEDAEIVEGPTALTINGQEAATAVIKGTTDNDTPLSAFITIIVNGDRVVMVIAATPTESEAEYRPQFEAIANSIEVGEPTEPAVVTPELPASEGILLYGDTQAGAVPADGAIAWEFIGLEGEVIDIIVRPLDEELDVMFDLFDESGNSVLPFEIDESFDVEELFAFQLPASGSYTIYISGFAGSAGDYELTLAESGTLAGAEGSIRFGESPTGSIIAAEGSSWSFSGEAGDFVDITVMPFDEFDLVVDVLDPSGLSLLDEGPLDDSFDTEFIRILPLPETGLYTIAIAGYEGEIGDYQLSLDLSNGGQPGSIIFAADTLTEDDTEGHAFPFTAFADETLTFQVNPEPDFDAVIQIFNDDTEELLDEVDFTTGFEELVFIVPEDGNYYFTVVGFEGSTGEYEATLLGSDFVIFELAIGDGVIGRFSDDGIIEYTLQGSAGDTLVLSAETNDELDLLLELLDLDDNSLIQVDELSSGGTETLTFTFEEDQVVFIRVAEFFGEQGQFILLLDSE